MRKIWSYGISLGVIAASVAVIAWANSRTSRGRGDGSRQNATAAASVTSREGLQDTIQAMERRLREQPNDATAAVSLADALLRQARVSRTAGPALRTETLKRILDDPRT
jgi:cytochrome c-type biogenesis protein CcmH/NrfG